MKQAKIVWFCILLFFLNDKAYSQFARQQYSFQKPYDLEVGAGIGIMNCITDIGGANGDQYYYINEIRSKNFRPGGSIYANVMFKFIGVRLEATMGQIQSADADIKGTTANAQSRNVRNLSFKNNIAEFCLLGEFHPFLLFKSSDGEWIVDPYVTAGAGVFSFNPKTKYNGAWVNLQPLRTEGQGFPEYPAVSNYKLVQINAPLGIGVRYNLSHNLNLRLEYLHRVLFTDYLDDASSRKFIKPAAFDKNLPVYLAADAKALFNRSTNVRVAARRGNPDNNDTYMSLSIKLGVVLGR